MIKGIGIDIEPVKRLHDMLSRYDREVLLLIFTAGELDRAEKAPIPSLCLALCFSAKEAMSKALGTGFGVIDWNEIDAEVIGDQIGIILSGKAHQRAESLAATGWEACGSTWEGQVVVTVVVE